MVAGFGSHTLPLCNGFETLATAEERVSLWLVARNSTEIVHILLSFFFPFVLIMFLSPFETILQWGSPGPWTTLPRVHVAQLTYAHTVSCRPVWGRLTTQRHS